MKLTELQAITKQNLTELRHDLENISKYGFQGQQEPQAEKTLQNFVKTMRSLLEYLAAHFQETRGLASDKELIRSCNLSDEQTKYLIDALDDMVKARDFSKLEKHDEKRIMKHLSHYVEAMDTCFKTISSSL